jgi:hypothetical protein
MRAARSSSEVKTTARPSRSNSFGSAAERLRIAPFGASEPNSATRPPSFASGSASGSDDRAVDPCRLALEPLAERDAGHGHAVEMKQRLQFTQYRANSTRRVQVRHVVLAGRLQVDEHRGGIR